jgi:amidase
MSGSDEPGRGVSAFCDDALGGLDGVALGEMVTAGEVSARELVEAAIGRADAVQPRLNPVAVADYERALATAESAHPSGVFAGVPTFVKGITAVAGLPNRFGSRAVPDTPASESSPTVQQLESTGVVTLGLSTTPEFALMGTVETALTGITRNPWSLDHSTGGSSGGSAALVAAGVVPVAHGTDGSGSIRIPASCCGIVGLKPSRGRIAKEPLPKVLPIDFAVDGILSRTVRDTAAFMFGAEQYEQAPGLPPVGHVTSPIDRRLRIGVITEGSDGVLLDSANDSEALRVAAALEELGHHVEPIPNPFPAQIDRDFVVLWSFLPWVFWHGGKRIIGPGWDREQLEPWTKWLVRNFRRQAASAPAAFRRLRRFVEQYRSAYEDHDVLLSATLGGPTHRIGYLSTIEVPGETLLARARHQFATTPIHNAGGGPAMSLPLATDRDGLPMGMHFAADVGDEATLLGLALQLEAAHPWPTLAPTDGPRAEHG